MKALILPFVAAITMVGCVPPETTPADTMQGEIEATNLRAENINPARSWLDQDHPEIFVYADEKMSWKMQSSMFFASAAKEVP